MRIRVWCMSLVLATLGVACGDQPTEVDVPQEAVQAAGMAQAPGMTADATATSDDGLMISTDKDDYQPGDTVYFTGSGWSASDTLDILLEDEPATHEPHTWWVPVQEDGTFRDSTYVVDIGDLDVTFTLTATSRSTGRSLEVTFTDGQPQDVTLDPASRAVPSGGTATYDVNVNMVGNSNACTVTLEVITALPAGASASFSGNPTVLPNGSGNNDFSRVLTITTTGATPTGSHSFTVRATRGSTCQSSGSGPTTVGTLAVFGPANKLAFLQQPTNEESATPISPAVTVQVLDAGNNLVANSSASITLAIGTNPGGGTLGGTLTQNAVDGVATFADLTIDKIGTGYTLTAGSSGLTSATSNAFNITLGPATRLAFFTQPSGGAPNTAFATQPRVEVQDAGGNRKTTGAGSGASITLAIVSGSGTSGAALACTTNPLGASAGLASFAGCRIDLAGTNYRLHATSGSLTAADSDPFDITPTNQPPNVHAGGPYTVEEGTSLTLSPTVTDPDGDALTYQWSVGTTGIDAGGTCTFDNAAAKNAKVTCTDDSDDAAGEKFTLTLEVDDGTAPLVSDNADLEVTNANPVADAGGPYTGAVEGTAITLNGSATDQGGNDTHTFKWTVDDSGIDGGGSCTISDDTDPAAQITCNDNGTLKVSLVATDDDGGVSTASQATLTVANVDPVADAGSYTGGVEGTAVTLDGSATDQGTNDTHTFKWTVDDSGIDGGGSCAIDDDTKQDAQVTCNDNGTLKVSLVATDDDGGVSTASQATIAIDNADPVITAFTKSDGTALPATLIVAGTLGLKVPFDDDGTNDTHTVEVDCGSGAFSAPAATSSPATGSCTFPTIGPVTIRVRVADDDGGYDVRSHELTVKYDFAGFYAPVDRPNTMNISKAGQAIPLKWTLRDALGAPVTDLATVTIKAVGMSCPLGGTGDQVEEYASGSSGLQNLGGGNYQFNWKTPTTYAGSCKSIELVFAAGGVSYTEGPHAFFTFKK